jgi:hypothetical protein
MLSSDGSSSLLYSVHGRECPECSKHLSNQRTAFGSFFRYDIVLEDILYQVRTFYADMNGRVSVFALKNVSLGVGTRSASNKDCEAKRFRKSQRVIELL